MPARQAFWKRYPAVTGRASYEAIKLAVGQSDPLAKIVKLHELGELPWPVAFERSKKATKAGFYPINLLSRKLKDGSTF